MKTKQDMQRPEFLTWDIRKNTEIKKLIMRYPNAPAQDYKQLTDIPTLDHFRPTKSYVLIVCKIDPNLCYATS